VFSFENPGILSASSSITHMSYHDKQNTTGDACSIDTEIIPRNHDDHDHDGIGNNGDGKKEQTISSSIKKKNFGLFVKSGGNIVTAIDKKDKNKNDNISNVGNNGDNPAKGGEEHPASAGKDNETKSSDASSTAASSNPSETKSEYTVKDHMPVVGATCGDECGALIDTAAMTTCDPQMNQEDSMVNVNDATGVGDDNAASKENVASSCSFDPKGLTLDVMSDIKDVASSVKRLFGVSYNFPALSYSSLKDRGDGVEMVLDGGNKNNNTPPV